MIRFETPPRIGVIIRFKNSAATLPAVLDGLRRQTVQPDLILGVNNLSNDGSPTLLREAGARLVEWAEPYNHPRVLNFGVRHCPTDLVLVLSSHTVLKSPDAIERYRQAMADPQAACASARWDDDPYYSESVNWEELRRKGLKFGSIYSNSMGMFRRSLWEQLPFDETLPTMEDGAWALEQVKRGYSAKRLAVDFDYTRSGKARVFTFSLLTFKFAALHGLPVAWLGPRATTAALLGAQARRLFVPSARCQAASDASLHAERLWAWLTYRWRPMLTQE